MMNASRICYVQKDISDTHADTHALFKRVPRRPRNIGDDGSFLSCQKIEKRRFAGVGFPDYDRIDTVSHDTSVS